MQEAQSENNIPQKGLIPRWVAFAILAFSLVGFFDATYLTTEHYAGGTPPCFLLTGCEQVTTSSYSVMAGIPVALIGAVYYLAVFILGLKLLERGSEKALKTIAWISIGGFLASLYFVYLQAFVIKAFCSYCLVSAITTTLILLISWIARKKYHFGV